MKLRFLLKFDVVSDIDGHIHVTLPKKCFKSLFRVPGQPLRSASFLIYASRIIAPKMVVNVTSFMVVDELDECTFLI